jgi:DNA-binding MarR family transcriptional regulator
MDQVARLEANGHARRSADPRDRRATLITLTATGLAAHRDANRHFERGYAAFVAALTVDEETAAQWLSVIRAAVETATTTTTASGLEQLPVR